MSEQDDFRLWVWWYCLGVQPVAQWIKVLGFSAVGFAQDAGYCGA